MIGQTDRYRKRPFTYTSAPPKRLKRNVSLPMDELLAIFRERLSYYHPDRSDPDAVTQMAMCEIERAMGVYEGDY